MVLLLWCLGTSEMQVPHILGLNATAALLPTRLHASLFEPLIHLIPSVFLDELNAELDLISLCLWYLIS